MNKKLGLIEQTAVLNTFDNICGIPVYRSSIEETQTHAFISKAYAIATQALYEHGIDYEYIITVKNAYRLISDNPNKYVTEEQKNFIRATVDADAVAIICNHEEEPKAQRIRALWTSKGAEVLMIECDEYNAHHETIETDSPYRRYIAELARFYGLSTSAPIYREQQDNDITMNATRHDAQEMRHREPNHITKISTSRRAYKEITQAVATDKELAEIETYHNEMLKLCKTHDIPLRTFANIDMDICIQCGKPYSLKQTKDEQQNDTLWNICPNCGMHFEIRTPITAIAYFED